MANLPSVVSKLPNDLRMFIQRVREVLDGGNLISRNDLIDAGIATTTRGGVLTAANQSEPIRPPAPTGVAASGAMTSILISWDAPNYSGHAYAEIWRSNTNNVGSRQLIGQSPGSLYADAVGGDYTGYYWVRFVSTTDTKGDFNSANGTLGKTAKDPEYLLEQLNNEITETQLYGTLNTRINTIDVGADSLKNQYTVKVNSNGHVAGFGIASEPRAAGGSTSAFAIVADRFYIAPPANTPGVTPKIPFVVQATPTTTFDGEDIPSGVYMDGAFITHGTIKTAQIGEAAIDTARVASLSAEKITFGEMSGDRIQANTLHADRIITDGFSAKLAEVTEAYIDTANIKDAAITNAKIDRLSADKLTVGTADIASAAITDAKIDRVSADKLVVTSADIAEAAITTAKIKDAQISTLKIANQAVTFPTSYSGFSCVHDFEGGGGLVMFFARAVLRHYGRLEFRLLVNGSQKLYTTCGMVIELEPGTLHVPISMGVSIPGINNLVTLQVTYAPTVGAYVSVDNPRFFVLGAKR